MEIQETSIEAKEYMDRTGHARNMRWRIMSFIRDYNGATCDEVERILGFRHQSASASIRQLVKDGILVKSVERRLTRSGRRAIVWKINERNTQITMFK